MDRQMIDNATLYSVIIIIGFIMILLTYLTKKQWDLMVYYTKLILILFAVLGGFTLVMAICLIGGQYVK